MQSVQRTIETSPAIHRWDQLANHTKSVQRTTEKGVHMSHSYVKKNIIVRRASRKNVWRCLRSTASNTIRGTCFGISAERVKGRRNGHPLPVVAMGLIPHIYRRHCCSDPATP